MLFSLQLLLLDLASKPLLEISDLVLHFIALPPGIVGGVAVAVKQALFSNLGRLLGYVFVLFLMCYTFRHSCGWIPLSISMGYRGSVHFDRCQK